MGSIQKFRFYILVALNLVVVLACLPAEPERSTPTLSLPLNLPTPTPLPPTPTVTPLPSMPTGTVVRKMTRKHETLSQAEIDRLLAQFLPASNLLPARDRYQIVDLPVLAKVGLRQSNHLIQRGRVADGAG